MLSRRKKCPGAPATLPLLPWVLATLLTTMMGQAAQADEAIDKGAADSTSNSIMDDGRRTYQYDLLVRTPGEGDPHAPTITPAASVTYTLAPNSDQLLSRNGRAVRYDAAGNVLSEKVLLDGLLVTRSHTYDEQTGRLKTVSVRGMLKATYQYDYAWRRISKTLTDPPANTPEVTLYQYNPNGQLVEEVAGSGPNTGKTLVRYVWIDDTPSAVIFAPGTPSNPGPQEATVYLEVDLNNTPRKGSDANGQTVWQWAGDPFGTTPPEEDPDGDGQRVTINLRFPGHYFDAESGLHYTIMRYYDPSIGRFTQPNPVGPDGEIDPLRYARENQPDSSDKTDPDLRRWFHFPTREEHVSRNKYNACPKRKPNLDLICSAFVEDAADSLASKVNSGHLKWRDARGNECAYDSLGDLLPDKDANYTYNYSPEPESFKHIWQDVLPHFIYGGTKAYKPNLTEPRP